MIYAQLNTAVCQGGDLYRPMETVTGMLPGEETGIVVLRRDDRMGWNMGQGCSHRDREGQR